MLFEVDLARLLQALAFLAGVFELLLQRVDLILVRRLSRLQRACPSTGENAVAMTIMRSSSHQRGNLLGIGSLDRHLLHVRVVLLIELRLR